MAANRRSTRTSLTLQDQFHRRSAAEDMMELSLMHHFGATSAPHPNINGWVPSRAPASPTAALDDGIGADLAVRLGGISADSRPSRPRRGTGRFRLETASSAAASFSNFAANRRRGIRVDPAGQTVRAEPGVLGGEIDR